MELLSELSLWWHHRRSPRWPSALKAPQGMEPLSPREVLDVLDGANKGIGIVFPSIGKRRLAVRAKGFYLLHRYKGQEASLRLWKLYRDEWAAAADRLNQPWLKQIVLGFASEKNWRRYENHLNRGQLQSKVWLANALKKLEVSLGKCFLLGGWYGALPAILGAEAVSFSEMVNVDLDPDAVRVAHKNLDHLIRAGRYRGMVGDGTKVNISEEGYQSVINTSCEHMPNFADWYASLPKGVLICLQSNDYFSEPEHCNCVGSLAEFRTSAPMSKLLFSGEQLANTGKYRRFLLIGYK